MPGDGIVSIGATVDKQGVDTGMADVTAIVEQSMDSLSTTMETAGARIKRAWERIPETVRVYAPDVDEAAKQTARGAIEMTAASRVIANAKKIANDPNTPAEQGVALLAAAQQNATAVALKYASSQEAVGAAVAHTVPQMAASSAAIRLFEGQVPIRAVERFIGSIGNIGPILQQAFPIIGGVVFAEMLVETTKRAVEAYDKFISLDDVTQKLNDDFQKMKEKDFVDVSSIETLRLRLDQANASATNLRETAQSIHDISLKEFVQGLATGNLAEVGGAVGNLVAAKKIAETGAQSARDSMELGKKSLELEHQIRLAKIEAVHAGDAALIPEQRITAELNKQLAINKENSRYLQRKDQAMGNVGAPDAELLALKNQVAIGKAAAERKVLQERQEDGLLARQWAEDLRRETELVNEAWENTTRAIVGDISEVMRAQEEQEKAEKRQAEEWKKAHQEEIEKAKEKAQAEIKALDDIYEATVRNIKFELELGRISSKNATAQLAAASQKKADDTVTSLQKEQSIFDPLMGQQEATAFNKLQDQMTAEQRKATLERERLAQQESLKFVQEYKKAAAMFNTDFVKALNSVIDKTQTVQQAFAKMFNELILGVADFVAQYLLKMAEKWAMERIMQVTGIGKQHAVQAASNEATVLGDAAVAAAGAMAYYSVIDPINAPAYAAIAFAETEAWGSLAGFERGGVVGGSRGMAVPILAHAGERVLTAQQTDNFHELLSQRSQPQSSGGAPIHMHLTQHVNAYDRSGMRSTLKAHASDLYDIINEGLRSGALAR